jgi:D-3-phosphoglycerate dehydrogenase
MDYEKIAKRIEKDKAKFVGTEIEGKTLGVIGLGAIGGKVVNAALDLGMNVVGFDPVLSLDAAWRLPGDRMERAKSLEELLRVSGSVSGE